MRDRVKAVMAAVFGLRPSEIPDDLALGHSDCWDSVRHMSLVLALEDAFRVTFSVEEIVEMTTLPRILKTLDEKLAAA